MLTRPGAPSASGAHLTSSVLDEGLLSSDSSGADAVAASVAAAQSSKERATEKSKKARCRLLWAMGFCFLFMGAEVAGGYFAHSLAIMTDAAHLLSDVASFAISLFAVWLAERPPTKSATFGFHRIEIFGAVASVLLIWVLTGVLVYEAILRIITPEDVDGQTMFIVAICGVAVNLVMMKILDQGGDSHHGHAHGGGGGGEHGHSHDVFKLFKAMVAGGGKGKKKAAAGDDHHGHAHAGGSDDHHGHAHAARSADEAEHGHAHAAGSSCGGGHGHAEKEQPHHAAHDAGHDHGAAAGGCSGHHGHGHGEEGEGEEEGAHGGSEANINVRAAFIHAVGDLLQSVGVMVAAIVIWVVPAARIADPICTFLFSILVLFTTFGVMRTALAGLLNSVPPHISLERIARALQALPGVSNVHDLHIWGYGTDRVALTVHLVADYPDAALEGAQRVAARHGIAHSTVQTERCGSAEVANCYTYNEHVGACKLTLTDGPVGSGSGGGDEYRPPSGGSGGDDASAAHHGHSHAGGGHGHAHGAGIAASRPSRSGSVSSTRSGASRSAASALPAEISLSPVSASGGGSGAGYRAPAAAAGGPGGGYASVMDRPHPLSRHVGGTGACGAVIATLTPAADIAAVAEARRALASPPRQPQQQPAGFATTTPSASPPAPSSAPHSEHQHHGHSHAPHAHAHAHSHSHGGSGECSGSAAPAAAGGGGYVPPAVAVAPAPAPAAAPSVGHSHSHGHGHSHGHSHGAASHAAAPAAPAAAEPSLAPSAGHGHSHAAHGDHGHSHAHGGHEESDH